MKSLDNRTAHLHGRLIMGWTTDFDYEQYWFTCRHHACSRCKAIQNKANGNRSKVSIHLFLLPKFTFIIHIIIHYLILQYLAALQIKTIKMSICPCA